MNCGFALEKSRAGIGKSLVNRIDCLADIARQLDFDAGDVHLELIHGGGANQVTGDVEAPIDPGEAQLAEVEPGIFGDLSVCFDRGIRIGAVIPGKSLPKRDPCTFGHFTTPIFTGKFAKSQW